MHFPRALCSQQTQLCNAHARRCEAADSSMHERCSPPATVAHITWQAEMHSQLQSRTTLGGGLAKRHMCHYNCSTACCTINFIYIGQTCETITVDQRLHEPNDRDKAPESKTTNVHERLYQPQEPDKAPGSKTKLGGTCPFRRPKGALLLQRCLIIAFSSLAKRQGQHTLVKDNTDQISKTSTHLGQRQSLVAHALFAGQRARSCSRYASQLLWSPLAKPAI